MMRVQKVLSMASSDTRHNKIEPADTRTDEDQTLEKLISPLKEVSKEQQLITAQDKNQSQRNGCCSRYSPRQWTIFIVFGCINVCAGGCYSLQAPFFPKLASSKGASASVYGMVFGVFELVNCIACFVYGKNIQKLGVNPMVNYGNIVMAICCILFGFLDKVPAGVPFISLAFIIRIVEALGQSAYLTASYATVAREFPENVATTFSVLETVFAVGMIMGPAAGGFLYEMGGYITPFAVTGSLLLLAACVTSFLLPKIDDPQDKPSSYLKLLTIPAIAICYYTVVAVSFSLGFTHALLQPHLVQFNLSSSMTGLVFMINGGTYALSATPWGFFAEKGLDPKIMCTIGGLIIALSFILIGPAPFLPIEQELWLLLFALVIHGIGDGAEYVSAFLDSSKEALSHGFPDNIETYGLVSGLWVSGLSLGSFLGPSLSGVLYDSIGFRYTALVVVVMHIIVVILSLASYKHSRKKKIKKSVKNKDLMPLSTKSEIA